QFGPKGVDPAGEGRLAAHVLAEAVRGAAAGARLEPGAAGRAPVLEQAAEGELAAALVGIVPGAPVAYPDGPPAVRIGCRQDQVDAGIAVIARNRALPQVLPRRIAAVVLDQVRMTFTVRLELAAHDPQSRALGIEVLLVARPGQRADDAFHVELVRVEEKANERLLVI